MKIISKNCNEIKEYIKFNNLNNCCEKNLNEIQKNKNIVILGNFDGVHKGHQKIFQEADILSKIFKYNKIVYTFREYPQKKVTRITTISEKLNLLKQYDIDYVYLEEFDEVRNLSPEDFIKQILVKKLNVKEIFCGFNFTFGKNKEGNIKTLEKILKEQYNNEIKLNIMKPVTDNSGEIISSTRIRKYIEKTDLKNMKNIMGHNYLIMGEVIHGKKLGRVLGFPTANLEFKDKIYPQFGVYGAYVSIQGDDKIYNAVINIGKNPTVDFTGFSVEAHILDFDKDIYGKIILIDVLERIRSERKMESLDELINQINNDTQIWRKRINEQYFDTNKNR